MTIITTSNLGKRFGAFTALEGLSLEIEPGIVGLVGANGAGKSTMLKILLGLLPPSSGSASVLGMDVVTHGSGIRERIGYMPEHDCLPPDVTATQFVVHMARMSGLPMSAARERAADTLRLVGLHDERYRAIGEYSTGMRQRVKLAQALVHDPALVLLDEPTNGLDPAGRDDMLALIARVGSEFGISVVVTSHLLGEIERVCDAVVVIEAGRLLRHTTTADATTESGLLAVELDGDPENLLERLAEAGVVVHRHGAVLELEDAGQHAADLVRDVVAAEGIGLVRMERRRHGMVELFTGDAGEVAVDGE